ncbi:MAG: hypothetical protein WBC88_11245 [Candidatus Zixiibacteriota bacterium]
MRDFGGTLESRLKPGTGFAFKETEEKSAFIKEPGSADVVDTFTGEGLES